MKPLLTSLACIIGLAFAAACSPTTVSFTFGDDPAKLNEAVVGGDAGTGSKVALIDVRGLISDVPETGTFGMGSGPSAVDQLVARLEKAERDDEVKAILIRINSPGGTVTGSDIAYREVRRFADKTKKPVVVSMGEIAASGGYYLALAGDEVMAEPTTITASIGVIIPTVNVSEGLNRIGIVSRSVKSGPNKDLANPLEPIRDSQYLILQGMVNEFYARFRGLVVERRPGVKKDQLDELTDGRVVTGERAAETGLVDSTGGVREAFEAAKKRAGVSHAALVKYGYGKVARAKTPYAESDLSGMAADRGTEVNLVQLRLGSDAMLGSGMGCAYYLWSPELWR